MSEPKILGSVGERCDYKAIQECIYACPRQQNASAACASYNIRFRDVVHQILLLQPTVNRGDVRAVSVADENVPTGGQVEVPSR